MEFKKERNFVVAYEAETVIGKWDIASGAFIGKSGKPVKSCPSAFVYNNLAYNSVVDENHLLGSAIRMYREWVSYGYTYNDKMGKRMEQFLSLGILPYSRQDLTTTRHLTKEVVAYCKEELHGYYDNNQVETYLIAAQHKNFWEGHAEWVKEVFIGYVDKMPVDFMKTFLLRAEHEHVDAFWQAHNYGYLSTCAYIRNFMSAYYKKCMELYGAVQVKPNLLANYANICYLYEQYKDKTYNEQLVKNNDKPFLYFQFGDYEARPILSREGFHEEGENQRNCVERMYMEKVYNGETYIVTVRNINNPNKSLITCEVSLNHNIIQYLGFANQRVCDPALVAFKNAYLEHLHQ